jgi:hypothetical protein
MELESFIEASMRQIIGGLHKASAFARDHGAAINPAQRQWRHGEGIYFDKTTGRVLTTVEFDVAVSATDESKKKEGIGVAVAQIMLGTQKEVSGASQHLSRIKFSVPVILPTSDIADEQKG